MAGNRLPTLLAHEAMAKGNDADGWKVVPGRSKGVQRRRWGNAHQDAAGQAQQPVGNRLQQGQSSTQMGSRAMAKTSPRPPQAVPTPKAAPPSRAPAPRARQAPVVTQDVRQFPTPAEAYIAPPMASQAYTDPGIVSQAIQLSIVVEMVEMGINCGIARNLARRCHTVEEALELYLQNADSSAASLPTATNVLQDVCQFPTPAEAYIAPRMAAQAYTDPRIVSELVEMGIDYCIARDLARRCDTLEQALEFYLQHAGP